MAPRSVRSRKLGNVLKSVIGWVPETYYFELLRASEGTLSRWSRLHLQSLAPATVSRRFDIRQAAGRKNNCRSLSQHAKKHVVTIPLIGIRVKRRQTTHALYPKE
jgi:hypothetical protein